MPNKSLWDVFEGAFPPGSIEGLCRSLVVSRLEVAGEGSRLRILLDSGAKELSLEDKELILACIDVAMDGRYELELTDDEPETETKTETDFEPKASFDEAAFLSAIPKDQIILRSLLKGCSFDAKKGALMVSPACKGYVSPYLSSASDNPVKTALTKAFRAGGLGELLFEAVDAPANPAKEKGQEETRTAAPLPPTESAEPAPKKEKKRDRSDSSEELAERKNLVLCGKPITTTHEMPLSKMDVERKNIVTRGIITNFSIREIQNQKGILTIFLTDYRQNLMVKSFVVMKTYESRIQKLLKKGETLLIKGSLQMDSYVQDLVFMANHLTIPKEPLAVSQEAKAAYESMLIGAPFSLPQTSIRQILSQKPADSVSFNAEVIKQDYRELRNGRVQMRLDVTDYTDSISLFAYLSQEQREEIEGKTESGRSLTVKGRYVAESDYSADPQIMVEAMYPYEGSLRPRREDLADEKRVELHLHTKMSEMDGVCSAKELVAQAIQWGHKAIAITDHGVVQNFPEAMDAAKDKIKVLYGLEAYVVDDTKQAVLSSKGQSFEDGYVVFDIETTGFNKAQDKILEIGAYRVRGGAIQDAFHRMIDPHMPIPSAITALTGITQEDVEGEGELEEVLREFLSFVGEDVLVAHNASFDTGFIRAKLEELGIARPDWTIVDTLELSRGLFSLRRYGLDALVKHLEIELSHHHRADEDALATAKIFLECISRLKNDGLLGLDFVNSYISERIDVKRLRPSHMILLANTQEGLKGLYELVSLSHLQFFYRQPRIPKSEILKRRESFMIGSACANGEVFEAALENDSDDEILSLMEFYDYIELQPPENYGWMIQDNAKSSIRSLEDLQALCQKIYTLAKSAGKMVAATGDVHFKEPEQELLRSILLASKKNPDADASMPLYFRTTDEMLGCFSFMGEDIAREIVIDTPNLIAAFVDGGILPVPKGQFSPVIEGAEEELGRVVYEKAHSLYGDPLPTIVEERIKKELECIIQNGFATLYILARRLVLHSNQDGYYVGSRGSVGSSLVATMAGITEINPLKAHYYCPECQYSDFDPLKGEGPAGFSGFDLPKARCPRCGAPLQGEGQDIPFEVFLGFDGDKEPDIDLNFSGEYQPKAHAYVEEMLGKDHVFRAGTVSGLAEKTAYGMVKNYLEEHHQTASNAQINFLISGITDVKRTTGQHPGGQIIVPEGYSIHDFTPVQYPANDSKSGVISTHYTYDQLHGRLLKLDILGHADPTMVRMLEDLTQTKATELPINDPKVLSLFLSCDALGVRPEEIDSPIGTYGIPEMGTRFVRQMLIETKPQSFSDLIRISGLSHGTNVWTKNAQDIIAAGIAPMSGCICTREDIMLDLIHMGVDKLDAFQIMERVRKGKKKAGLTPKDAENMRSHGVPEWYIDSCKKIQYLFPKAHAAAYVTMALRVAYYKVYHKEAYYAAFFTIRADSFDYEAMAMGADKARRAKRELEERSPNEMTAKDKEKHTLLELIIEFYARGLSFLPMDLYESDAHQFRIVEGKLLPPFDAFSGLGTAAAQSIVDARRERAFDTIEDFSQRTQVSRTLIEEMKALGIFQDMPETDQLSLF